MNTPLQKSNTKEYNLTAYYFLRIWFWSADSVISLILPINYIALPFQKKKTVKAFLGSKYQVTVVKVHFLIISVTNYKSRMD